MSDVPESGGDGKMSTTRGILLRPVIYFLEYKAHMHFAKGRQHVVFAEGEEVDVRTMTICL